MATKMQIVNMALANLGRDSIATLNEGGKEAAMVRAHYDTAFGDILSTHAWGFATRRPQAALLIEKPVGFQHAYAYPVDSVRVLRIMRADCDRRYGTVIFEIGRSLDGRQKVIHTNCPPPAAVEYTTRNIQPSELPDTFVQAFSWRLSAAIALGINNDPNTWQMHMQTYSALLQSAKGADTAEAGYPRMPDGEFIDSRRM